MNSDVVTWVPAITAGRYIVTLEIKHPGLGKLITYCIILHDGSGAIILFSPMQGDLYKCKTNEYSLYRFKIRSKLTFHYEVGYPRNHNVN